jgi:hypothetical protein
MSLADGTYRESDYQRTIQAIYRAAAQQLISLQQFEVLSQLAAVIRQSYVVLRQRA